MCGCSWERSHTIARANLTAAAASHRCPHPVALVLCLNVGVDPPDLIRTSPCARRECWVEPSSMVAPKAIETIGKTLQAQYERWQPRARYKQLLDPTVEVADFGYL